MAVQLMNEGTDSVYDHTAGMSRLSANGLVTSSEIINFMLKCDCKVTGYLQSFGITTQSCSCNRAIPDRDPLATSRYHTPWYPVCGSRDSSRHALVPFGDTKNGGQGTVASFDLLFVPALGGVAPWTTSKYPDLKRPLAAC